jgi:hypothetical protein
VSKSLEDFRITLERVTMVAKWVANRKEGMGGERDSCRKESLKLETGLWTGSRNRKWQK